jgi:hypothetical protein
MCGMLFSPSACNFKDILFLANSVIIKKDIIIMPSLGTHIVTPIPKILIVFDFYLNYLL